MHRRQQNTWLAWLYVGILIICVVSINAITRFFQSIYRPVKRLFPYIHALLQRPFFRHTSLLLGRGIVLFSKVMLRLLDGFQRIVCYTRCAITSRNACTPCLLVMLYIGAEYFPLATFCAVVILGALSLHKRLESLICRFSRTNHDDNFAMGSRWEELSLVEQQMN